jgi:cation transport ATPase
MIAIPLAAGVLWVPFQFTIPPPLAGLNEIFSTIPVIIFSLLLKTFKPKKVKITD